MKPRCWSWKQLDDEERKYPGNLGYQDGLGSIYHWTDLVSNSKKPNVGDLIILVSNEKVLGVSWIDEIESGPGIAMRYRCPNPKCNRSGTFKLRKFPKNGLPRRCEVCGFEGNEPIAEEVSVIDFVARYDTYWRSVDDIAASILDECYLAKAKQHSIRELSLDVVNRVLETKLNLGSIWWRKEDALRTIIKGGSKLVIQRKRIGQQEFRAHLLEKYGDSCAISGACPAEVLEAAHLYRYSNAEVHDLEGGLLLRRDLHILFDRWLLTVNPTTLLIEVSPRLSKFDFIAQYKGSRLKIAEQSLPNLEYLERHFEVTMNSWN
jgi:HNH endonuclease